jgi:integrase
MTSCPQPKVKVLPTIQTRLDGRSEPYIVRHRFDGRLVSSPFPTMGQARSFHARLTLATEDERHWNRMTGLPASWDTSSEVDVAEWSRRYLARWYVGARREDRTVAAVTWSLALLIERSAPSGAPSLTKSDRSELMDWLVSATHELSPALAKWVAKWSPKLYDLDGPTLSNIDWALRQRVDGSGPLGQSAASRNVKNARRCLDKAVITGLMVTNDWPVPDKGDVAVEARHDEDEDEIPVLSKSQAALLLQALITKTRASLRIFVMTLLTFKCGLRPGEVTELTLESFTLPATGWGTVSITKATTFAGTRYAKTGRRAGKPKTKRSKRIVPVAPLVVAEVRDFAATMGITSGPLFYTSGSKPVTSSNWCRSLEKARVRAGLNEDVVPYSGRHFYASHASKGHVDLVRLSQLMGNSTAVLNRWYLHLVTDNVDRTTELLEAALG